MGNIFPRFQAGASLSRDGLRIFRRCYGRPSSNIPSCVQVGGLGMSARNTKENRLALSVLRVDTTASRAAFARIARVNGDNRNAGALGLVGQESAELAERPVGQAGALGAAGRNLGANVLEFFKRDSASSAFGIQHDFLGNAVICVSLEPRLFAGKFDETTLGGLRPALLETGAPLGQLATRALYAGPAVNLAVAGRGDGDNAKINADPIGGLEAFGLWNVACCGKHPLAAHETQIDLALAEFEQGALVLASNELEAHASFERPYRNLVIAFEAEDAIVVGLRGVGAENRRDLAVDFECVGDFGDAAHGGLCGKAKVGARRGVGELVERELSQDAIGEALGCDSVAGFVAARESRLETGGLFAGRQQFDCGDELHVSYIEDMAVEVKTRLRLPLSLLALKGEVSRGELP